MNAFDREDTPAETEKPGQKKKAGHSRWMMIACCVPMLVIAAIIAIAGAGFGFLVVAVMCTAMMALMMGGMSGGGDSGGRG